VKVVMNLNDDLIKKMREFIKKKGEGDMTSLVVEALNSFIDNGYNDNDKVYDLNALGEIQMPGLDDLDFTNNVDDSGASGSIKIKVKSLNDLFKPNMMKLTAEDLLADIEENCVGDQFVNDEVTSLKLLNYDKPLWGQTNRYFPLKAALRSIYFVLKENFDEDNYLKVSEFNKKSKLFLFFSNLGMSLSFFDKESKRSKSEKVATGFPNGVDTYKLEKSCLRFMSHYLFEIRRDNKVDGALAKLKFIKVIRIDGQGYKVGITKAGHEFAQLNNPYFDGIFESCGVKDYSNPELVKENTLSENEKSFLINHLKNEYSSEYDATLKLLKKIDEGYNKPTSLMNSMKEYFDSDLTNSALNTTVNGLVSRATELSLLTKEKIGLNVTYNLSRQANNLLNQED
tara:strand:+ start:146 stop:1339 length:1194 start_codon:yes stop_codon:yes gene_type:complete